MSLLNVKQMKVFAQRFEMDKAVIFGLFSKSWIMLAGPVTAFLIATYFTGTLQGYYYTFATILALQVFIEMGLSTVTQQFVSHEWAKLSITEDGTITGDPDSLSRLLSIAKISFKWFFYGSVIACIILLAGGYFFFSTSAKTSDQWLFPWVSLSVLTAVNIFLAPFWAILEGCNQVTVLYRFRLIQAISLSIATWIPIVLGAGLWVSAIASLTGIVCAVIFFRLRYLRFFSMLLIQKPLGPVIKWNVDMLPMQWRIAVAWISGYLSFSLFTPILFKYQSPEIAGQFGMTWNIISAIGGVASSWLVPRVPGFGILIAQKNYPELDRIFKKLVAIVFMIILMLAVLLLGFVIILPRLNIDLITRFASRLLPPVPVAFLLLAQILVVTSTPFSYYMRAHKKEPLMLLSVISGILIGISTYYLGRNYSVTAVTLGYLVINIIFIPLVVLTWYRFRKHQLKKLE